MFEDKPGVRDRSSLAPVVYAIVRMMSEPGFLIGWEAPKTLREIGDACGVPALVEALEDPDATFAGWRPKVWWRWGAAGSLYH